MATIQSALDHPILPRRMRVGDPRIPQDVSERFGNYGRPIVAVGPVVCIGHVEWMLFDADDALVDVLRDGPRTAGTH